MKILKVADILNTNNNAIDGDFRSILYYILPLIFLFPSIDPPIRLQLIVPSSTFPFSDFFQTFLFNGEYFVTQNIKECCILVATLR